MDSKRIGAARSRVYIIVTSIAALLDTVSAAGLTREYTIAEARKHIGENATVVGMVTCVGNGRRHTDLEMGGCLPATLLWIVVPNDVSGPELDCWKLPGVTIAVTGKIESSEGTPQITIKSTTQIVRRTSLDPNYLTSANEKENKRDLDGAIADLDRAIDLTHEPGVYMQRARLKENKGDVAGAIRDYDQMIEQHARLDEAVRASYHDNRAKLKIKNRDFDGAIADATAAIQLNPRFPWHYATRGQANEGKGDFAAAIKDYKMAIQTEPHNSAYKDMLRHAQAVASRNHEQSFNKSEVTPESIAEAFVQAHSGANVDAVAALYADRVDHTNSGVISNAAVRAQAKEYFARWPVRQWSLVGPVNTISLGATKQKVIFSATYDVSDPQTNKHTSGIAKETLILATDASGAMKIVSQKEQISKHNNSHSDEKTSEGPAVTAAKAEYEASSHDETARVRYVTKLAAMLGQGMEYWWRTHDRMGGPNLDGVDEELIKHPMPRNVNSRKLSQLLIGEWESPRHVYAFRADGTYGVADEQRDKWRIDGNEYIDDVARGKIILIDDKYFVYAEGQAIVFYLRVNDSAAERKVKQAEAEPTANTSTTHSATSLLAKAEIIDVPRALAELGIKAGNVKVTFADGHAETVTKNGNCMEPHVSAKGDVGWIHCTGFDRKGYALNDEVVVRSSEVGEKQFKPLPTAPFIGEWNFATDGSAIVIQSRSFHGPASYARYDLATGKLTNSKAGRNDEEPLPTWAQPLSY
jgi:tetratricopeptide (TPR) repeat protein